MPETPPPVVTRRGKVDIKDEYSPKPGLPPRRQKGP